MTEGSVKEKTPKPRKGRKPIPPRVERLVWARAAGRCQYAGSNKPLIGDPISGTPNANGAYVAHIISAEPDGPRGHPILSPQLATDPINLMLVCDVHHCVFDRQKEAEHPAELLRDMKRRHEERIAIVTTILTREDEIETWMMAPPQEALRLQRPRPDNALRIVSRGERSDDVAA